MKRCRIGATDIDTSLKYWTDGRPDCELRASQIEIFSAIDLLQTYSNFARSEHEIDEHYTNMDRLWAAFCLIDRYGGDRLRLKTAGIVYEKMAADFAEHYETLDERNDTVNNAISEMFDTIDNRPDEFGDFKTEDMAEWWKNKVMDKNYYFDPYNNTTSDTPVYIAGIGDTSDDVSVGAKIKEGGTFFLYRACKMSSIAESRSAMQKRNKADALRQNIIDAKMDVTSESFDNNVTSGIMEANEGANADECVEALKENKNVAVGELITLFALIVAALVIAITAICKLADKFHDIKQSKLNQELARQLAREELEKQKPVPMDFNNDGTIDGIYDPVTGEMITEATELEKYKSEQNAQNLAAQNSKNMTWLAVVIAAAGALVLMN